VTPSLAIIPNLVTLVRLAAAPLIVWLLVNERDAVQQA